jgi:DNA-binding transcriptional LysR family regulator
MNLAAIDTNLVVALYALLEEKNVTRAAKRIGLGQSATSHALSRLREHFGDPLLVRVGRALVLTEKASALVGPAADAARSLERLFAPPEPFDPRTSRRVFRIAATDNLELYVLPRLSKILAREAPRVDLRFHHLPKDWPTALARGEFELKLGRKYEPMPALRDEDLFRDHFVCVVRRGHPAPRKLTLRQYAALSHILVAPGESERGFMDDVLSRHRMKRRVAIVVPHFLVALFAVAASDHVLTTPARLVEATAPALHLRTIELPVRSAGYILSQVWPERYDADEGHRWLRGAVRRTLRK